MKHNLMGKEKIENLGFDQVNSYDNEERVSLSASQPYSYCFQCGAEEERLVQETGRDRQDGREELA